MNGWRMFIEDDVRPHFSGIQKELRNVLVGPGWSAINWYERIGRLLVGLSMLALVALMHLMIFAMVTSVPYNLWKLGKCITEPTCHVILKPARE